MIRMQWFKENYLCKLDKDHIKMVADIGSQCVPGQKYSYKTLFNEPWFKYTGLDMIEGHNVEIVLNNVYKWDEVSEDFCDVLISGQVFEHVEFPWFTIQEMARILKPNGLLCIIVPSMQRMHRHPVCCQNYFSDGLIALAKYAGLEVLHASTNCAPPRAKIEWYNKFQDSMLIASKPTHWNPNTFDKQNYTCVPADLEKMATGLIPMSKLPKYKQYIIKINNKVRSI